MIYFTLVWNLYKFFRQVFILLLDQYVLLSGSFLKNQQLKLWTSAAFYPVTQDWIGRKSPGLDFNKSIVYRDKIQQIYVEMPNTKKCVNLCCNKILQVGA